MTINSWSSLARHMLWRNKAVYRIYRRIRFHDDPARSQGCKLWVGGFPRSSNTYTARCLAAAAGGEPVAQHLHTPPEIQYALSSGKPGIFVLREPKPAVISWAIYNSRNLGSCLDYYIDFHRFNRSSL